MSRTASHSHTAASRRRLGRLLVRRLVALLLSVPFSGVLMLPAPAAEAAVIGTTGSVGTYSIPRPECWNRPAWGQVELKTTNPSIYATNYNAGGGNDAQYVRYRVLAWDMVTASYVGQTGFSANVIAYDNRPATFSGTPASFRLNRLGRYRLVYQFEFFHPRTGALSGRQEFEVVVYSYFNAYQAGPIGPMDSCMQNG